MWEELEAEMVAGTAKYIYSYIYLFIMKIVHKAQQTKEYK